MIKKDEERKDPLAEKFKKKARKAQFFEVMGDTLDKITHNRYDKE